MKGMEEKRRRIKIRKNYSPLNFKEHRIFQGFINLGPRFVGANKLRKAPNMCVSLARKMLHVTFLAPKILKWLNNF
jgi:hypothetical protein